MTVRPLRSLAVLSLTALACGDATNTTAAGTVGGDPIGSTSQSPPGSTGAAPTTGATTDDPGPTTGGAGSSGGVMPPDACEGEPPLVSSGLAFDQIPPTGMQPPA